MKKRHIQRHLKRGLNLVLVAVIALQGVTLFLAPKKIQASENPNGPLKSVIVHFKGNAVQKDGESQVEQQVAELAQRQEWLSGAMQYSAGYKRLTRAYSQLPYAAYDVDAEGEASLRENPNVLSVVDDQILSRAALPFEVTPGVLEGDFQTGFTDGTAEFTGDGYAVAVLDDGVDKTHPSLAGTVAAEACFGINQDYINASVQSVCPGGALQSSATGSGVPCPGSDCSHGTMVGSMVAMQPTAGLTVGSDPVEAAGIAQDAKLIAIQVNVAVTEKSGQPDVCGDAINQTETCYAPQMSMVLAGLNHVLELHNNESLSVPIAAANVSLGTPAFFTDSAATCSAENYMTSINTAASALKGVNIATIVAAGNSGDNPANANRVSAPACLSDVVAVSASTANDHMTSYTNAGPLTDLVAPGGEVSPSETHADGGIFVARPGADVASQYEAAQGTSFSAPIVAATWAVLREKAPDASVDGILAGLKQTGVDVVEDRAGYTAMTHKRIDILAALEVAETFAAHTPPATTPTPIPANPPVGGGVVAPVSEWTPGTPNAGGAAAARAGLVIVLSVLLLGILNRRMILGAVVR